MQPVPMFDGPAEYDELLQGRVAEHQYPGSQRFHHLDLGLVPERSWNNPKIQKQLIAKVMEETIGVGQAEGLGTELYDARGNYSDDAMQCWRIGHNRTTDCGDYMSDKMTILADSIEERKDLGLNPRTRAKIKLCQFCVFHTHRQSMIQAKKEK